MHKLFREYSTMLDRTLFLPRYELVHVYNTHCKALHRVGVNLWVQTTVGGWVWLKSHLDLVGGTEKIAMAHGVIREVKDLVLAR